MRTWFRGGKIPLRSRTKRSFRRFNSTQKRTTPLFLIGIGVVGVAGFIYYNSRSAHVESKNTGSQKPTLWYFNVRGRAEPIRMCLEDNGIDYNNIGLTYEEWKVKKPTFPAPNKQLPYWEEGDVKIFQTHAIIRHIARKYGMYGKNEVEQIRCDIIQESYVDSLNKVAGFTWNKKWKEEREQFLVTMEKELLFFDNILKENKEGKGIYFVGKQNTYVDYLMWNLFDYCRAIDKPTLQKFPELWNFYQKLSEKPKIKAYSESDRKFKTLTVPMAPYGGTPETS